MEDEIRPKITVFAELRKELKEQFLPANSGWVARESLRRLKHTGTVREYVKEFTSLMLDIKDMSEGDKLFNFMAGLQSWAQIELRRSGVIDLSSAIVAADSLVDLQIEKSDSTSVSKLKKKGKFGDKPKRYGVAEEEKDKGKSEATFIQQRPKMDSGCFICKGPHRARDCPKKEKVNAMVAEEANGGDSDSDEGNVRVNPLVIQS